MNRYIIGFKNEEFYMISSMNKDDDFEKEVKKFNNGLGYRYEEVSSKIDIRKGGFDKLIKELKLK